MRRRHFLGGAAAAIGLAGCSSAGSSTTPATGVQNAPNTSGATKVADLRFGFAPLPPASPGYDPAGDSKALIIAGTPSPATSPIPGLQYVGSYAAGEQYFVRIPASWNGKLAVVGTPAFRSAFASDAIWGDFLMANGYAYASSNKGIPYNAVVEPIASSQDPTTAYPIPFDLLKLETAKETFRLGALTPRKITIDTWNADFAKLTITAQQIVKTATGVTPTRTYAVGVSNGGAEVRALLEQYPNLVDGGVDWEGVLWTPQRSILDYMPVFLKWMPQYVASGFTDATARAAIMAAGYPADIVGTSSAHPSLWFEYYAGQPSFYTDLTLFAYALLIDPTASSFISPSGCTPDATNPAQLPGTCAASGLGLMSNRQTYTPSAQARAAINTFAHTGKIGKPLVSIAGTADMFITPQNNATPYLAMVNASGAGSKYWQYLVTGGTHVDTFAAFPGYGLQAQLPFAWAAFKQMVAIVENGYTPPGAGTQQTVSTASQIKAS